MAIDFDKMTAQEWADWNMKTMTECLEGKPNKYRARRTEYGGVAYDSKHEAEHAAWLDRDPRVKWWLRQVRIPLGVDFSTRVDFLVGWDFTREVFRVRAHEVKGVETREFKRVRKLWPKYGPFPLHIIKRGNVEILEGKP